MTDDPVRDQYEAYPYPPRDPADEARRLIAGSPSHLLEINHFVFAGRRDFSNPFRALVAGGGTGDGAVMLAQQLADGGGAGEVVYTDISAASLDIARARTAARGFANVTFLRRAIEDLSAAEVGRFDYVDCCGVLHHLADPAAGLRTLTALLREDGGMGLMVYGSLGRTGVYPLQALLRAVAGSDPLAERVALARRLLDRLPETNWVKRNPQLSDHLLGDAGLVDLLLHARDQAYTVPEVAALTHAAGLAVTGFVEPLRYDPASYVEDPDIRARLRALPWLDQCAAAENLAGNLRTHVFYAVPEGRAEGAVASPDDAEAVPVVRDGDGARIARRIGSRRTLVVELDGLTFRRPLPEGAGIILAQVDGRRTVADIHQAIAARDKGCDWLTFFSRWRLLFDSLHGIGQMYLGRPIVGGR